MCFKIDWGSFTVGSKFTVFALFYLVFEGRFPSTSPRGDLYLEWLIFGGAYFRNFTVDFLPFVGISISSTAEFTEREFN